jgi:hypothetical protein
VSGPADKKAGLGTCFWGGKTRPRRRARDADDFYPTVQAEPVVALLRAVRAPLERALAAAPAAGRAPVVLDPCCGAWDLARPICAAGIPVVGADVVHPAERGCPEPPEGATWLGVMDFLGESAGVLSQRLGAADAASRPCGLPGVVSQRVGAADAASRPDGLPAGADSAGSAWAREAQENAGSAPAREGPTSLLPAALITNPPFKLAVDFLRQGMRMRPGLLALLLPSDFFHAGGRGALWHDLPPALELKLGWRIDWTGEGNPTQNMTWWVWHGPAAAPFARQPAAPTRVAQLARPRLSDGEEGAA